MSIKKYADSKENEPGMVLLNSGYGVFLKVSVEDLFVTLYIQIDCLTALSLFFSKFKVSCRRKTNFLEFLH